MDFSAGAQGQEREVWHPRSRCPLASLRVASPTQAAILQQEGASRVACLPSQPTWQQSVASSQPRSLPPLLGLPLPPSLQTPSRRVGSTSVGVLQVEGVERAGSSVGVPRIESLLDVPCVLQSRDGAQTLRPLGPLAEASHSLTFPPLRQDQEQKCLVGDVHAPISCSSDATGSGTASVVIIGGATGIVLTGRGDVGTGGGEDGISARGSVTRTLVRLGGGGIDRLGGGDGTSSITEPVIRKTQQQAISQTRSQPTSVLIHTTPARRGNRSRRYVRRRWRLFFARPPSLQRRLWRRRKRGGRWWRWLGQEVHRRGRYRTGNTWGRHLFLCSLVLGRVVFDLSYRARRCRILRISMQSAFLRFCHGCA